MVNQAEEPLRKVTLNLFESDVIWIQAHYAKWSESVRDRVRESCNQERKEAEEWLGELNAQ